MSDDWSEGYVTEIDYTWGFHKELSPTNLAWASALRGHTPPPLDGPFNYFELGCGNGLSLNVFAAAHPNATFYGADFNPSHVANGRRTAEQGGIKNVHFLEKSFADLATEKDLPELDFIVLHGIWTWVSAENRQHILSFLRDRLKPGGLVYLSFNALPGWSEMVTVRRIMLDAANRTPGDLETKIKTAVQWLQKYWNTQNKEAASRSFKNRIERILKSDVSYLAHEYFNKDWTLFFFQDVAQELRAAKLNWLTSATLEQTESSFYLSRSKLALVREIADPIDREQMRDYLSNGAFRRDIFLKGSPDAALARDPSTSPVVQSMIVGPRRSNHQFQNEVKVPAGTLSFKEEHERVLFEQFKDGPRPVSEVFDPLWALGRNNTMAFATLRQMVACDLLRPWARRPPPVKLTDSGRYRFPLPFNEQTVADIVNNRARKQLVAAPNAGTAVGVSMREAYLLHSIVAVGMRNCIDHAIKLMEGANRRLIVDGHPLQGRKAHEEELGRELERFARHKLAHFVALGVLEPALSARAGAPQPALAPRSLALAERVVGAALAAAQGLVGDQLAADGLDPHLGAALARGRGVELGHRHLEVVLGVNDGLGVVVGAQRDVGHLAADPQVVLLERGVVGDRVDDDGAGLFGDDGPRLDAGEAGPQLDGVAGHAGDLGRDQGDVAALHRAPELDGVAVGQPPQGPVLFEEERRVDRQRDGARVFGGARVGGRGRVGRRAGRREQQQRGSRPGSHGVRSS